MRPTLFLWIALGAACLWPALADSAPLPAGCAEESPNDVDTGGGNAAGDGSDARDASEGEAAPPPRGVAVAHAESRRVRTAVDGAVVPAIERYPRGEKLTYRATVSKAGITADVGKAVLTVTPDASGVLLSAHAKGSSFGYTLDTKITTLLDAARHPLLYTFKQEGSEKREKKLIFGDGNAAHWRFKHCRRLDCTNPEHFEKSINWKIGFIPWGKKRVHCMSRKCDKADHLEWQLRCEHICDRPYIDMLTALYEARGIDFDAEGPKSVAVINDTERWLVNILVRSHGECRVQAGTFDAYEITLEPVPLDEGQVRENFRGLFGMHGTISLWIDAVTRRPVKVEGTVPFGAIDLHASVELIEVGVETEATAGDGQMTPARADEEGEGSHTDE